LFLCFTILSWGSGLSSSFDIYEQGLVRSGDGNLRIAWHWPTAPGDWEPEARTVKAALDKRANGRGFYRRSDLVPADVLKQLPMIVLMDVIRDGDHQPFDLLIRLIGTDAESYYGKITGMLVSKVAMKEASDRVMAAATKIVESGRCGISTAYGLTQGQEYLTVAASYFPFMDETGTEVRGLLIHIDVTRVRPVDTP